LVLFGTFDFRPVFAIIASAGVLLGAWYLLQMLYRVFFGPVNEPPVEIGVWHTADSGHGTPVRDRHNGHVPDLTIREWAALVPIALACIFIGVYPKPLLDASRPSLEIVTSILEKAKMRSDSH
jgi:NADH-quinone oxidoreductase subunit M